MKAALQLVSRRTRLSEIRSGASARFLYSGGSGRGGREAEERKPAGRRGDGRSNATSLRRAASRPVMFLVSGRRRLVQSGVTMNRPFLKVNYLTVASPGSLYFVLAIVTLSCVFSLKVCMLIRNGSAYDM